MYYNNIYKYANFAKTRGKNKFAVLGVHTVKSVQKKLSGQALRPPLSVIGSSKSLQNFQLANRKRKR